MMKFKDYKIEIPGCTDILFFAGFTIKGIPEFSFKFRGIPGGYGSSQLADHIPSSGELIIDYYSSDDLSWIIDWMEYIHRGYNYMPDNSVSNISKRYARRQIKMYNKNCIFTFFDAYPCKIEYDDSDYSIENILSGSSKIKVVFKYSWVEKRFI